MNQLATAGARGSSATGEERTTGSGRPGSTQKSPASVMALRIVQEASRGDVTLRELAVLAQSDPGFAIRVLKLVNSTAYGFARQVSDTQRAVAMIGIRSLRNLALSLVLTDMVPMGEDGNALLGVCIRRAAAARLLAERLGAGKEADEFFTAGLFLESGLLIWAREDLAAAAEIARLPASQRVLRERLADRVDHARGGAELARQYGLPAHTALAVEHHHDEKPPVKGNVARVCWVAERFAGVFEGGDVARSKDEAVEAGKTLGLLEADTETVLHKLPKMVEDIAAGFSRRLGKQPELDSLLMDANKSLFEMNQNYEDLVRRLEALIKEKEELTRELHQANALLEKQANTDTLTQIANHRAFRAHLLRELAWAERTGGRVALALLDVDKFKVFNDTYGHQLGDEVLRSVGRVLQKNCGEKGMAARYGGEEFVLVLTGATVQQAVERANIVREAIEALRVQGPRGVVKVTASFGVAGVRGAGARGRFDSLVEAADKAMYAAKDAGRNRVCAG